MSDFTNYLRVNKQIEKSIRKSEEKKAIKRLEEKIIYSETSEEYKAIKWLENKTTNYSDNSLVLHYNNILYYLIMNLMKENKQLKQENQMLKLTVEKLTKRPYEYSVRGNL